MREAEDDVRIKAPATHEIGCDLSAVSVDELEERMALLAAEIERLRAERDRKRASREAADAFFR